MGGLYAIVDVPHPHGLSAREVTEAVLGSRAGGSGVGADLVQLRAKDASTSERVALLEAMAPACLRAGVPLIVNDDLDAALRGPHGVRGVHLGQGDPGADDVVAVRARLADRPQFMVGLSTHNAVQLREAGRRAPDYVAFGPIGRTDSKKNADPPVGRLALADACRTASTPLVAIGGLDLQSGARAIGVGARWVAMIGALAAPTVAQTRERAEALAIAFAEAARPMTLDEVARAIPVLPPEQLRELAAWSDSLGVHLELGLPARFRPRCEGNDVWYRPWDVLDLCHALGKQPHETWDQWRSRAEDGEISGAFVQLRVR